MRVGICDFRRDRSSRRSPGDSQRTQRAARDVPKKLPPAGVSRRVAETSRGRNADLTVIVLALINLAFFPTDEWGLTFLWRRGYLSIGVCVVQLSFNLGGTFNDRTRTLSLKVLSAGVCGPESCLSVCLSGPPSPIKVDFLI